MNFQTNYVYMNVCLYLQMSALNIPTGMLAENEETVHKMHATLPNWLRRVIIASLH